MDQRPRLQGAGDTALDFFTPISLVVWLTVFSPIIISSSILLLSLVFQNFKGFLYLGLLLLCSFLRSTGYKLSGSQPFTERRDHPDCSRVKYNNYGNNDSQSCKQGTNFIKKFLNNLMGGGGGIGGGLGGIGTPVPYMDHINF